MKGYEALRGGCAWIDLSQRGKIRATGEDRVRLLHAMTTNQIEGLAAGQGTYAFFLNSQGRILADALIFVFDDSLLIDTEPETGRKVFEHLDKYIIADDATLAAETDQWAEIALEGPKAAGTLTALQAPVPPNEYAIEPWISKFVARVSSVATAGFRVLMPHGERAAFVSELARLNIEEADAEAARTVRIENAKPRYGEEISERYLVQETGQMHAVNYTKGCYLGQEIVERVRSRAQIHRKLAAVRIEGSVAPAPRTKLQADGKDVAEIASAAYSPALGEVVALAYVRTEAEAQRPIMVVSGSETKARLA